MLPSLSRSVYFLWCAYHMCTCYFIWCGLNMYFSLLRMLLCDTAGGKEAEVV